MKRITFLFALATVVGVIAFAAPASRRAEQNTAQNATPIFVKTIPLGYRDWRLISVAREEGDLKDISTTVNRPMTLC